MTISKPLLVVVTVGVILAVSFAFWFGAFFGAVVPQTMYRLTREGMIDSCSRTELRRARGRLTLENARERCACEQDTIMARWGFDRPGFFGPFEMLDWMGNPNETLDEIERIQQACREEFG